MSGCCHSDNEHDHDHNKKKDYILWGSLLGVILLYSLSAISPSAIENVSWLKSLASSVYELMNIIWWGILIGFLMVSLLSKIPKEFVISVLGTGKGTQGIIRATIGGIMLDLCSHGILMVGSKLYERGASAGQVVAFLVASPWNSFSLTIILITLIGLKWTLIFTAISMVIAIIAGIIFDRLVKNGTLPDNKHKMDLPKDFNFKKEAGKKFSETKFTISFFKDMFINGVKESRMVLKWILFGVILAGLVKTFVDTESFQTYFGPTLTGLGLTIVVATILEVCSEGSLPIAADIFTRANAPGNSFTFLMTGVSTDYTEIMILKDTTKSLKFALFLPIVTLPQIIFAGYLINQFGNSG